MLIGLGKVIPGVSGSLIAVSLGVYEKAIDAISHFFQHLKENVIFLGTLGMGIIISVAFGSKLLIYLLEFFYVPTMFLFIGFITGVFPSLLRKIEHKNKQTFFLILISMLFVLSLQFLSTNTTFYPENNLSSYLLIVGIGFLDAMTMVIPGISGTAIFMILGCYGFVLNLFASFSNFSTIFSSIPYFFCFGVGLFLGIIIVSKIMFYLFKKYKEITYSLIMGFTFSSILVLIDKVTHEHCPILMMALGLILAVIGYLISCHFGAE